MLLKPILLTTLLLITFSCKRGGDSTQVTIPGDTAVTDSNKQVDVIAPDKNAFAEFSALRGNEIYRVRDWRKDISLKSLGAPRDTSIEILGEGADTHMGASIHTYKYDNLILQFYGPKDGTDNWLNVIQMTGPGWTTARGIEVGDSVSDLKTLYPKASNELTGDPNLYRYEVDESTIEFTVKDEVVSKIELRYNIPSL
ncbi:MAG: hypothetical protein ABIQ11_02690 [Saprospiraceae bacterium]